MDSAKILIVDDDEVSCAILKHMLSENFSNFLTAANGVEGLSQITRHPDIDLILLDLEMPIMNGKALLSEIRNTEELRHLSVIVVASNRDDAILTLAAGADDFITKPYDRVEMTLRIKNHLQKNIDSQKRIRAEHLLRRSEENLLRAQSVAQTGSWSLDLSTGDMEWSAEARHLCGIDQKKPFSIDDYFCQLHPEDRALVTAAWHEILHNGTSSDMVYRLKVNGSFLWIRGRAEVERNDLGKPLWVTGTVQNITALREAEIELQKRNDLVKEQRDQLEDALARISQLEGIIPICSYCKKIKDDKNSWLQVEAYITRHSEAVFSHGVCPECAEEQRAIIRNMRINGERV